MSKRKISSYFQRATDKIIDKAEEKIKNEFHEEKSDAWLPNLKPRNFLGQQEDNLLDRTKTV